MSRHCTAVILNMTTRGSHMITADHENPLSLKKVASERKTITLRF